MEGLPRVLSVTSLEASTRVQRQRGEGIRAVTAILRKRRPELYNGKSQLTPIQKHQERMDKGREQRKKQFSR